MTKMRSKHFNRHDEAKSKNVKCFLCVNQWAVSLKKSHYSTNIRKEMIRKLTASTETTFLSYETKWIYLDDHLSLIDFNFKQKKKKKMKNFFIYIKMGGKINTKKEEIVSTEISMRKTKLLFSFISIFSPCWIFPKISVISNF